MNTHTPTATARLPFLRPVVAIVLGYATLIAATFVWVAIYSYVLAPGLTDADYEAYAQRSTPYVAALLSFPVFFVVGRAFAKAPIVRPARAAVIATGIIVALDFAVVVAMAPGLAVVALGLVCALGKIGGAARGARRAHP